MMAATAADCTQAAGSTVGYGARSDACQAGRRKGSPDGWDFLHGGRFTSVRSLYYSPETTGLSPAQQQNEVTERDGNARQDLAYGSEKHPRTTQTRPRAHMKRKHMLKPKQGSQKTYDVF
jgi:hypothetical protein